MQGVRKLVKGLPALEMISFGSMGKILNSSGDFDDIAEPLKLIHFNELDPECGKKFNLFKLNELFLHAFETILKNTFDLETVNFITISILIVCALVKLMFSKNGSL